jgi:hypothetical protein
VAAKGLIRGIVWPLHARPKPAENDPWPLPCHIPVAREQEAYNPEGGG